MQYVQDNAEESVRRVIDVLRDGQFSYPDDDGTQITCKVSIDKASRSATIDFTGLSCGNCQAASPRKYVSIRCCLVHEQERHNSSKTTSMRRR